MQPDTKSDAQPDTSASAAVPARRKGSPLAIALVLIVAMICGTIVFVVSSIRGAGTDAATGTHNVVASVVNAARQLMSDIVTRKVDVTFSDEATRINGSNYLQFATLKNVSWFQFTDSASVAGVRLPDVEFIASAPVEYTYYVDLNANWDFVMPDEKTLEVYVPEIGFNAPAVEVSRMKWWTVKSSAIRDEDAAAETVKKLFSSHTRQRARENIEVVREEGRARVEQFVRKWVVETYGEPSNLKIVVYFADEKASPVPPISE